MKQPPGKQANTAKDASEEQGPRKYPLKDLKLLYGQAAARCAFADCRKDQILEANPTDGRKQIGKIAHIVGHKDDGPRGDPEYPREKLDTYDNWILLCPTHHDTVDALVSIYTADDLRRIKAAHEQWVRERLATAIPNVGFAELEIVTKAIARSSVVDAGDLKLTPPDEKIQKNGLTGASRFLITTGLSQSKAVGRFIEGVAQLDPDFPDRLIDGFRTEYDRLQAEGTTGDLLFEQLREFAGGENQDFTRQAAGLVVLAFLFERCDIFEK